MNGSSILGLLLMLFLFSQCQSTQELEQVQKPFVQAPIPALDPSFDTFEFDAAEGTTFRMASGSEVRVSAGALLDVEGQVVSGMVEGRYRELHDVLDIYLAGIPMAYDSISNFETAGTFELHITQNGEDLRIDPNKAIQVKMASFEAEDDYDFYFLDEAGRQWDSLGTTSPDINPEWLAQKERIRKKQPGLRFPLNRKYFALNYEAILDIFLNNRRDSLWNPAFRKMQDNLLKPKLDAYGLGWTKVGSRKVITFKGRKEPAVTMVWKNLSGKAFPEWTKNHMADMEQIRGNRYQLNLYSRDSTKHFSCQVAAIMPLRALFAFSPEYWVNNYKKAMLAVQEEQERLQLMAEVYRSFDITQMGIYNWDRLLKMEESIQLQANFQFESAPNINEQLHQLEIVLVTGDSKGIIKIPQERWSELHLMPNPGARLFCLLPGNRLAVFAAEDYAKIDFEALRKMLEPARDFDMQTSQEAIQSTAQFRQLLGV
ncbi:MAG: hypothetical protein AAFP19_22420 [Bacteroidota bacterium]